MFFFLIYFICHVNSFLFSVFPFVNYPNWLQKYSHKMINTLSIILVHIPPPWWCTNVLMVFHSNNCEGRFLSFIWAEWRKLLGGGTMHNMHQYLPKSRGDDLCPRALIGGIMPNQVRFIFATTSIAKTCQSVSFPPQTHIFIIKVLRCFYCYHIKNKIS